MKLRYHGTQQEVRFGDEVVVRRLFRRSVRGTVCHIHGGMSSMPELEAAGVPLWTVRDGDGQLHHFVLAPERPVAPRGVRLVARAGRGSRGTPEAGVRRGTPAV